MKRRSLLKGLGAAALAPSLSFTSKFRTEKPVLRIAHITDVHLKDDLGAPKKFERCLHHIQQHSPKVDLILNGGDIVFDMNKEKLNDIDAQWKLMESIMKNENDIPVKYCLGNHDVWWNEDSKDEVFYGKKYSLDRLELEKPYYSFSQNGWKFIILDSTHQDIDDTWYIGKLGNKQMEWLSSELKNTPEKTPILIMSHIPILTSVLMIQDNVINRWEFLGGDMHTDCAQLTDLFYEYPNVKLCLSGHIHMRDKVVYNDVTYICDGAVSGAWWNGIRRQTNPGYGLIDLYADGSFNESYINY
ncbi:metallophosphoesterase family protein [Zunongwangia atlantica]|uniref:Calcineurin-like phosphoesterase n=1 Tax=Zunongwangia atlantica 22II14-10F7 TaxID=1185767 RepID=A0A1Y1T6Q0_9FLAO|nr:metallophosphoesterase [Zunongwangia atlantica]ORL46741.1 calcineurin-like phosphoesterase [Zunongwangia atlantica 22II14-10F7]